MGVDACGMGSCVAMPCRCKRHFLHPNLMRRGDPSDSVYSFDPLPHFTRALLFIILFSLSHRDFPIYETETLGNSPEDKKRLHGRKYSSYFQFSILNLRKMAIWDTVPVNIYIHNLEALFAASKFPSILWTDRIRYAVSIDAAQGPKLMFGPEH